MQTEKMIKPKAYSKAEKLRRKRGRPRMEDVVREPNGRKSRRKLATARRRAETEKEVKAVVLEARMRHGIPEAYAASQEAGNALGRVMIAFPGLIKRHHYEAGLRCGIAFARYYALTGIPFPSARAADLFRVCGLNDADRSEEAKKATNTVMNIERVIGMSDCNGKPVTKIVKQVCIADDDTHMFYEHMAKFLAKGLDVLVDFFGIERNDNLQA